MSDDGSLILKNASYIFVGSVVANIASFGFRLLLAREFGAEGFGTFSLGLMIVSVITTVCLFGVPDGLVNFIGKYRASEHPDRILGDVITGTVLTIGLSLLFLFTLRLFSSAISTEIFGSPELKQMMLYMSFVIPANVLVYLSSSIALGYEKGGLNTLIKQIFPRFFLIALAAIVIFFDGQLLDIGVAYSLSMWMAGIIGAYFSIKLLPIRNLDLAEYNPSKLLSFSAPLMLTASVGFLLNWTDTAIVGIFLNESSVGVYQASFLLGTNLSIFLTAIASSLYAKYSALLENKNYSELARRYQSGRRWAVLTAIAPTVYLTVFAGQSLSYLFGAEFSQGRVALIIIVFGQFLYIFLGPSTNLLKSADMSKFVFWTYLGGAAINTGLNIILVPRIGIVGASVGTATGLVVIKIAHYLKMTGIIEIKLFDKRFIPSISAIGTAVIPSYLLSPFISSPVRLIFHILVFSSVYCVCLYLFGGITDSEVKKIREFY
ncbi:flippase [Salinigranum halophilum]|uniref:flippase n=1 Tax=Salinigranum halophilum TaxID=2565931 RepID=UPI0013764A6C|nr:flippase [Salinigranum halophilum]